MARDDQEGASFAEGVTVWLVDAPAEFGGPAIFWERVDADAFVGLMELSGSGGSLSSRGIVMRGERRRCRLCGEPIVLDDPADPESWCHTFDANDLADHPADP